jgi:hypothetical protein
MNKKTLYKPRQLQGFFCFNDADFIKGDLVGVLFEEESLIRCGISGL